MAYTQSTVATGQAVSEQQREAAVASHVEALVALGWRWEGRGLTPTIQPGAMHETHSDPDSANLDIEG